MAYTLVIVDKGKTLPDIVTDDLRVDFVTVGQIVLGRRHGGSRIDTIVNLSSVNFTEATDPFITAWWDSVKRGIAKEHKIVNECGGSYET